MNERVAFLTMESDNDLIVSFVLLRGGLEDVRSLILMRTPKYEFMLDPGERRVHETTRTSGMRKIGCFRSASPVTAWRSRPTFGNTSWTSGVWIRTKSVKPIGC